MHCPTNFSYPCIVCPLSCLPYFVVSQKGHINQGGLYIWPFILISKKQFCKENRPVRREGSAKGANGTPQNFRPLIFYLSLYYKKY